MEIRDYILYVLEHYNQMRAEMDTLRFELQNLNRIKDSEIIESMTFATPQGERVNTSERTDKTSRIALAYKEQRNRIQAEAVQELAGHLSQLALEIERLDFYIGQLPPFEASILKEHYFENYSWRELQDLKGISTKTLIRRRDEAVAKLVQLYEPLARIGLLESPYFPE